MSLAVEAVEVSKRYGHVPAVDHVSLHANRGEVIALVGPNGAGKTTLLEICGGLRTADEGRVVVLGHDPARRSRSLTERIGISLQHPTGLFGHITPAEAIWFFGGLYRRCQSQDQLLAAVSLESCRDTQYMHLSAGQRQRLSLALAMINDPEVFFLDEPSTSLDPEGRRDIWRVVRTLAENGACVLLSTHDIADAEPVSDRVGVIAGGRLIGLGTPQQLIGNSGAEGYIDLYIGSRDVDSLCAVALPGVSRFERRTDTLRLFAPCPAEVRDRIAAAGAPLAATLLDLPFRIFPPRLEDAYFKLIERPSVLA